MASFIDRVKVFVQAGNGGHGCTSVLREKYKPLGGPDGGNGGDGGSIILNVDPQMTTLLDYHHLPHRKAQNGTPGMGGNRDGSKGEDLTLPVPPGTVVKDAAGNILVDFHEEQASFVIAQGGQGGKGNAALSSKRRKAPGFALLGEPGESREVILELKSVADVALVGFPSAGKSSLIGALSEAKPKIADYPFTTLVPNLGVVQAGEIRYTMADVPGLIPGAAQGKGLGHDFLRHIERCQVLVHVVDCASFDPERNPVDDIKALEKELAAYPSEMDQVEGYVPLGQRPRVIALNKMDIPDAKEMVQLVQQDLLAFGWPVFAISALSQAGLEALNFHLAKLVQQGRKQRAAEKLQRDTHRILRPKPLGGPQFEVRPVKSGSDLIYQVWGDKPIRWVAQTDFSNDEAVGFLSDRLNGLGVEEALGKAGAKPGDTVVIGSLEDGVIFDWEPAASSGAELLGARGRDLRLEDNHRRTNQERRQQYHQMMDAKAAARAELDAERQAGMWTDPS